MAKSEVKTTIVDKATLLSAEAEFETAEVELKGLGTVTVRALSRAELHRVQEFHRSNGGSLQKAEEYMVQKGLVDPYLTADEVSKLFKGPYGRHVDPIVEKVNELSGIEEGAAGEATERFPEE